MAWGQEHVSGGAKEFEAAQAQITQELLNQKYTPWLDQKRNALRIEILVPEFRAAGPAAGRGSVSVGG